MNSPKKQRASNPKMKRTEVAADQATGIPVYIDSAIEQAVGITVKDLAALYVLDGLKGFGPQKFKLVHSKGVKPAQIISSPGLLYLPGKRGKLLREELDKDLDGAMRVCEARAARQIVAAHKHGAKIITYTHPSYPATLFESNYPVPILYARGATAVLQNRKTVACVGSRKIRPPYALLHEEFVRVACDLGFTVVSGFALGADTIGHETARKLGGQTICVMPGGLDRPFPPENKDLWQRLLAYPHAVFVSEFAFGTSASALSLRRRNKGIVALACGVLVSQSSEKGGAMNAYRFAVEQHKPLATFSQDGMTDTSGNALITQKEKADVIVFPGRNSDPTAYEKWLQKLCSST
jgi:DNA protecting protein DprA